MPSIVKLIPNIYLETLKDRDFLLLSLIVLLYQASAAFILLALVLTVYAQTGSNFSVSGVILSFAVPGFFLMAVAGFVADLMDRKKIIIVANIVLAFIVLLLMISLQKVHTSIFLSFMYFSANAFFLPASSAAVAQIIEKSKLLTTANSIFIFTLAGGQLLGFFVASIIFFLLGNVWTIIVCEIIIIAVIWLSFLLPPLSPRNATSESLMTRIIQILEAFIYILRRKVVWFFFLAFAFMQGLIAFGITLAPGFFNDVVGLAIGKSPIILFPLVAIGVVLGVMFVHNPKIHESFFIALGLEVVGLSSFILGVVIKLHLLSGQFLLLPLAVFLPALGFGVIISMIASRAVLSKTVDNAAQGTVFGALVVLAAFFASVMSPMAAGLAALIGYVNILILGGLVFGTSGILLAQVGRRWKF